MSAYQHAVNKHSGCPEEEAASAYRYTVSKHSGCPEEEAVSAYRYTMSKHSGCPPACNSDSISSFLNAAATFPALPSLPASEPPLLFPPPALPLSSIPAFSQGL